VEHLKWRKYNNEIDMESLKLNLKQEKALNEDILTGGSNVL